MKNDNETILSQEQMFVKKDLHKMREDDRISAYINARSIPVIQK